MTEQTIPVVSLSDFETDRAGFCRRAGEALAELGFVAVEDHGISQAVFDAVYRDFAAFFALPEATKQRYERPEVGRARGYTSFGVEHAKDRDVPDLKEFFHVGREVVPEHPRLGRLVPNAWPTEIAGLREHTLALFARLDRVAAVMLEALSRHLGAPPDLLPSMAEDGNTVLRVIHYPVCEGFDRPGAMRAAEHEDINLMTLLPPSPQSGLEILTRHGEWTPVRAIPGQIVVDTGDMTSRVTNGRIPATTHRVVNPAGDPEPRYSMPFFVHPHVDTVLEVLPQCLAPGETPAPPIGSEEFLLERLRAIGVARAPDPD
ncbi:MAG TPA: 2-oxoglutarate and iron-dependent oxygenase domain-containing protein [Sandaracinaceae bacterium LLY-WYZ-13_1]|nr:2-oxoglutarate and iron-dependent oxygenase domain-containing protein [Sandaracinaceae bacterium LLY-WYZ-13_1]